MNPSQVDLMFPHLGIVIEHMKNHITVFGNFDIAFYGMIIGSGMLIGLWVACRDAKRRGQDPDIYLDFLLYAAIFSIIGARLYYVAFQWDYYKDNLASIFNIRQGGLAIYGGVIAGFIVGIVYTKVKKLNFLELADTAVVGLITGQAIGRWGNFFNCEAFGGYTDSLFAMRIREAIVNPSMISDSVREHMIIENGVSYIQVHPTFLYESVWNFCSLIFMLWYGKHKQKYIGEIMALYFLLYGTGRFIIEGMRTDQLLIPGTTLAVSQCLSLVLVIAAIIMIYLMRKGKLSKELGYKVK
ncbi:MAG: prolipoprotein diacylglyceryl transferase [Eubacteriales bacterium]|nr:prolipoprotein diacylglyceryl transferase [Eubacteriales bacterium]